MGMTQHLRSRFCSCSFLLVWMSEKEDGALPPHTPLPGYPEGIGSNALNTCCGTWPRYGCPGASWDSAGNIVWCVIITSGRAGFSCSAVAGGRGTSGAATPGVKVKGRQQALFSQGRTQGGAMSSSFGGMGEGWHPLLHALLGTYGWRGMCPPWIYAWGKDRLPL